MSSRVEWSCSSPAFSCLEERIFETITLFNILRRDSWLKLKYLSEHIQSILYMIKRALSKGRNHCYEAWLGPPASRLFDSEGWNTTSVEVLKYGGNIACPQMIDNRTIPHITPTGRNTWLPLLWGMTKDHSHHDSWLKWKYLWEHVQSILHMIKRALSKVETPGFHCYGDEVRTTRVVAYQLGSI